MTRRPAALARAFPVRSALFLLALTAGACAETRETREPATLAPMPAALASSPAAVAVRAVGDAAALAITGRQEGDAAMLVEAAERMIDVRSVEDSLPGQRADADTPPSLAPAVLLGEAEDLAGEDASLAARIALARERLLDIPSGAGPAGGAERGPLRYASSVAAGAVRRHELQFAGPEAAVIQVRGSGASNLDVYLYDVNGDRVAFDEHASDVATVHWYVPYTQTLTLVVRNRGARANAYYVITN